MKYDISLRQQLELFKLERSYMKHYMSQLKKKKKIMETFHNGFMLVNLGL